MAKEVKPKSEIEIMAQAITTLSEKVEQIATQQVATGRALPSVQIEGANLTKQEGTAIAKSIKSAMSKAKYKNFDLKPLRVYRGTETSPKEASVRNKAGETKVFPVGSKRVVMGVYEKGTDNLVRESLWHFK